MPTDSVASIAGKTWIPDDRRLVFGPADHVDHMAYFDRDETRRALLDFVA